MSKNAEGWIRHRGGKCPVDGGAFIDVRYRGGHIDSNINMEQFRWNHDGGSVDIMAYRLHKPAERVSAMEKIANECGALSNLANKLERNLGGPLQWRDRIAEIDATTQALTTERAELVQRLASEGFALIGRINDMLTEAAQKHEDMSDWRNWKVGDLVEMVNQKHWADMTDGKTYALTKAGSDGFSFEDDVGDKREAFARVANDYAKDLKWHSRPSA